MKTKRLLQVATFLMLAGGLLVGGAACNGDDQFCKDQQSPRGALLTAYWINMNPNSSPKPAF